MEVTLILGKRVLIPLPDGHDVPVDLYIPEVSEEIDAEIRRPAVIICPGGAYRFLSHRESEPVALDFAAHGFNAFVVWYRVTPFTWPKPQWDTAAAVQWVRTHAEELHVHPDQIALLGFSAGAHCACSVAENWQNPDLWADAALLPEHIRPNALILAYPVITAGEYTHRESLVHLSGTEDVSVHDAYSLEKHVTAAMPPTFLWHTWQDELVPVENSFLLASALRKNGVLTEMHIYPYGSHGSSLCRPETSGAVNPCLNLPDSANWTKDARRFLKSVFRQKDREN
ncbi:MAG: alpha/beta hydrolase [Clostridiales bacterium]|nr:alpha/beta hydrolase [Clostridiales bacterium]